jgi:hypothetical protein
MIVSTSYVDLQVLTDTQVFNSHGNVVLVCCTYVYMDGWMWASPGHERFDGFYLC